ncbi:hypothetical protein Lfu02_56020 [Longispora fulva]|nr:hypothetical protein [Longispora fulva]GIG61230.1 hypothetical protein Lfu02_56020 [Longispora fulva]
MNRPGGGEREPVMTSREHAERVLDTHVENLIGSCGRCYADTGRVTPAPCPTRRAARRYLDSPS